MPRCINAFLGSKRSFAALETDVGNGRFLTVMAEGSGPIVAPGTSRREGRIPDLRRASHQCLLFGTKLQLVRKPMNRVFRFSSAASASAKPDHQSDLYYTSLLNPLDHGEIRQIRKSRQGAEKYLHRCIHHLSLSTA
jgi:hypothetical protein